MYWYTMTKSDNICMHTFACMHTLAVVLFTLAALFLAEMTQVTLVRNWPHSAASTGELYT